MGKTALDEKRVNAFAIDPNDCVIIGLDTNDGPEHPLYDERATLEVPTTLVDRMVRRGWTHGAIEVRRNGSTIEVVVGRQRVKAARAASKLLLADGKEPIMVRAFVRGVDGAEATGVAIGENELRFEDPPVLKAQKARRLLDNGATIEDVAEVFGVEPSTITLWQTFYDLAADVQKAVKSGEIAFHAALPLAKLSRDEQTAALASLPEDAPVTGKALRAATRRANGHSEAVERPGIRKIKRVLEANKEDSFLSKDFEQALRWVLGEVSDRAIRGISGVK